MKDLTQGSVMRHLVPHGRVFGCQHGGANALFARRSLLGRPSRQRSDRGSRRGWKPNDDRAGSDASARRRNDHTYIARCGQKDQPRAEIIFNQSFTMSILVGLALGVCGFAVRTVYCDSLSADAITAELAKKYLLWFIPALALQFPLVALGSALRATGVIKPAVGFPVLSVLLNIALAPLLIFGIGPWPRLGVIGAALATFISILIADILIVIYFEKKYHYLRFRLPLLRPQIKIWRQMLAIGVPAGAEFVLLFVYILLVYVIIRGFGPASQAGFGVGARVMQALFLPVLALSFAVAPVVGQNFGGRRADRVRQSVYAALGIASAMMFILTLIAYLVPSALIRVFSQDPRVIAFRGDYLKIVSLNFRGCRNRLYRFQCVPRNGQYPAAVAQLNNTP
jgi:putative MATE family efflux protein